MAAPTFQHLDTRLDQDVLVLTFTSKDLCDEDAVEAVRQELLTAVDSGDTRKAVLDFQHVTYIASPGIRLLLGFRRHFQTRGGRLVLCALAPLISDVLNTARLISAAGSTLPVLFETAPDVPAGIARLNR